MFQTKAIILFSALLLPVICMHAGDVKPLPSQSVIRFTENKGQWDGSVLYRADLDGGELFLEKNALLYNFYDKEALRHNHAGSHAAASSGMMRTHAFKTTFINTPGTVKISAMQAGTDYCNFFIGRDKNKWVGHARNFGEVYYASLYSGIDLQVLSMQNSVKYNFIVSPAANTGDIQLRYEGLQGINIMDGELVMTTSLNRIVEEKPYAYQKIKGKTIGVKCEFVLGNNTVHFRFPEGYDKAYALIIDPVLIFACSSGSTADNFGMTATYDSLGNLYSGGTAFDVGFPTTLGALDSTYNGTATSGKTDVVITKYSSDGTQLLYSTYFGGATSTEIVTSLIVDGSDNLILYGATGSSDFPVTANAYDTSFNGGPKLHFIYNGTFFDNGTDIYVSKFNAAGTALLGSTYIGGTQNDGVNVNNDSVYVSGVGTYEFPADSLQYNYGDQYRGEVQADAAGNYYIASSTRSGNFPIVGGADSTFGGQQDAVILKLNSDLSAIIWSTYLGGSDNDAGYSLVLNGSSGIYVTGGTRSNDFPADVLSFEPAYNGGRADGYIARLSNDGTTLLNATYIGTTDYDQTYFIRNDAAGNVYVFGQSLGVMPVVNALYSNTGATQFVSALDGSLGGLIFSTNVGSGIAHIDISPSAFEVDPCGNIYLSGWGGKIVPPTTTTTGMPVTPDAVQATTDGHNFYLMALATNSSALLYASYFGGANSWEHVDGGTSRFDKNGVLYQSVCAGCGGNDDFPVTPGSWPYTSPSYMPYVAGSTATGINRSFNCNNGTFKFDFQTALICSPMAVKNDPEEFYLNVFPNPGQGLFTLESSVKWEDLTADIYNILGEKIASVSGLVQKEKGLIDISEAAKGVYFIKVTSAKKTYTKKIIIE